MEVPASLSSGDDSVSYGNLFFNLKLKRHRTGSSNAGSSDTASDIEVPVTTQPNLETELSKPSQVNTMFKNHLLISLHPHVTLHQDLSSGVLLLQS